MTTLPNIGLIGRLRSGKDTAADYLASKYGYSRFAFGDELKRYYHELFGETDAKPREGYQWFGQAIRERDPDVWVRKCLDRIAKTAKIHALNSWAFHDKDGNVLAQYKSPAGYAITDVRQPNEYGALKRSNYVLIRVEAPEALRIQRAVSSGDRFNLRDLAHGTETALDDYAADFTVTNDAGLSELYAQIDDIIDSLRSPDKSAFLGGDWPE
ncbi:adenylate kinase [Paenibacillus sp. ACRRY]|uniref:adenylate kinase n=1 Tax=Paenibacillus sp. ACRRY TaxID=2918208 RepID=UPI001EF73044|nr:adenylate kinase [Paenibacillus sp. ACRRY]MCG7383378.1 adenylate kinase [Paenibacillus sp. ACRRY]